MLRVCYIKYLSVFDLSCLEFVILGLLCVSLKSGRTIPVTITFYLLKMNETNIVKKKETEGEKEKLLYNFISFLLGLGLIYISIQGVLAKSLQFNHFME